MGDENMLVMLLDGVGEGKTRLFGEVPLEKDLSVLLNSRSPQLQAELRVIFKFQMMYRETTQNCREQTGSGFIFELTDVSFKVAQFTEFDSYAVALTH